MTTVGTDADIATTIEWAASELRVPAGSVRLERITGGRSNITSRVLVDGTVRCVLREPPEGNLLPTAHDLGREYRVLTALDGTDIPVARPIALHVSGGAYLMSFVEGTGLADAGDLRTWRGGSLLNRALTSSATTLGRLHRVVPADVGLVGHGRGGDYVGRQLRRWLTQWTASPDPAAPSVPALHDQLLAARSDPLGDRLVHGDYHFGNLLLGDDGALVAVVDWELSTIGDPRADLGSYLAYLDRHLWSWRLSNFSLTSSDVAELGLALNGYGGAGDDGQLAFHLAWAHWKLTCIGEGVLARYRAGAMQGDRIDLDALSGIVRVHAAAAHRLLVPSATARFAEIAATARTSADQEEQP